MVSDYRSLLKALYLVGLMLVFVPVSEHLAQIWPPKVGSASWRFGAAGLLSGSLPGVLLGLGWIMLLAAALKHRRTLRLAGVVSVVLAIGLLMTLGLFALDFLQVRAGVNPRVKASLDITVMRAIAIIGLSMLTAGSVGFAAWRSSARATRRADSARSPGIIYRSQAEGGDPAV